MTDAPEPDDRAPEPDDRAPEPDERRATWAVRAMAVLAVAGIGIASYLAWTKLAGEPPVCGPLVGCETVQTSEYSAVFGIPVAVFGLGYSVTLLGLALAWLRGRDRRALVAAYVLGILGLLAVGYLTYLEIAVIGAICVWCVSYAVTVVAGWLAAVLAVRWTSAEA